SIPYSTQAQGLVDLIEDEAGVKSMYIELINAYRAEDLPVLHKLILEEMNSPREEAFLLSDRNQSWILPLREVMNQHQAFIAVGAGHLAGESGVINLLRESGYRVSPVFN
ncbi:MAG TPA: TraB/GumN family protein, partial [Cryomorphaceae bacterium]|nr:TraB/GumN family protein [Cryomorphaceae bacterium]